MEVSVSGVMDEVTVLSAGGSIAIANHPESGAEVVVRLRPAMAEAESPALPASVGH